MLHSWLDFAIRRQVSGELAETQSEEPSPTSPNEVLGLTAPNNMLEADRLLQDLQQYKYLCLLGLQNNTLEHIDLWVSSAYQC